MLHSFTVKLAAAPLGFHPTHHCVYYIAGDEADREKDENAEDKQGGDDEQ